MRAITNDPLMRDSFRTEAHQRLIVPLSVFSFAMIPLACLLPGEFNRRAILDRFVAHLEGIPIACRSATLPARVPNS